MNINALSKDKQEEIIKADGLLDRAGLPTYTELATSRQTLLEAMASSDSLRKENDAMTAKLLQSALKHLYDGANGSARAVIAELLPAFEVK